MVTKVVECKKCPRLEEKLRKAEETIGKQQEQLTESRELLGQASVKLEHYDDLQSQYLKEKAALDMKCPYAKFKRLMKDAQGDEVWQYTTWLPFNEHQLAQYKAKGFIFAEGQSTGG